MANKVNIINEAKQIVTIEEQAISQLKNRINQSIVDACHLILDCKGHTIVMGMGKSGHIASKIAATLASTGTPAFFVHPAEACHGDLGMVTRDDVIIAISNSGETDEFITLLPVFKRFQLKLISITGNPHSTLAKVAHVNLDASVEQEACPFNLAPTASTTSALVWGDVLAITLLKVRGFTPEDFALSHPSGRLGKQLLWTVSDVMRIGKEIPKVLSGTRLHDALIEISSKRLGIVAVVDEHNQLKGVFTDGDLRRCLENTQQFFALSVNDVMTQSPTTVKPNLLASELLPILQAKKITSIIVVDEHHTVVGALNIHDILKAGIL